MNLDRIYAFDTEAAAIADPVVGAYYRDGAWNAGNCLPGPSSWANFQVVALATGEPIDAKWRIFITDGDWSPDMADHPNLGMAADRDAALAGAPRDQYIIYSAIPSEMWTQLAISPAPAYSFGA